MNVTATYSLNEQNELKLEYRATTSKPTVLNLTNHSYFNLSGNDARDVMGNLVTLHAEKFTPVDATLIPTGERRAVAGTPFDFRTPHKIGERIATKDEQFDHGHGYDHNWVLNKARPDTMTRAAVLRDPTSGREIEFRTTQPGLQFYSGNFLDGKPAGGGTVFAHRTGLCLETQHFPDSPNQPAFPTTILRPGQTYSETTVLAFRRIK